MSELKHEDSMKSDRENRVLPQLSLFQTKLECIYFLSQYHKSGTAEQLEKKQFLDVLIKEIIIQDEFGKIKQKLDIALAYLDQKNWKKGLCHELVTKSLEIENVKNADVRDSELADYRPTLLASSVDTKDTTFKINICLPLLTYCHEQEETSSRNIRIIQSKIEAVHELIKSIYKEKDPSSLLELIGNFKTEHAELFGRGAWGLFHGPGKLSRILDEIHEKASVNIASSVGKGK